MKAAKTIAILMALPLLLTCELLSGPYDRENPKDPLNPNYAGWFGIRTVDSTGDVGQNPTLRVSGDNIFISYFDQTNYDLKFARSTDGGTTFVTETVDDGGVNNLGYSSSLAIRPHSPAFDFTVVYRDDTAQDLKAKHWDAVLQNWELAPAGQPDRGASLVVEGCSIAAGTGTDQSYYASECLDMGGDNNLYFIPSADGISWGAPVVIDSGSSSDVGMFNSIAVSGEYVYVSFLDMYQTKVRLRHSDSSGTNLALPGSVTSVGTTAATLIPCTATAASGTNVHVAWFDGSNMRLSYSEDGGSTFTAMNGYDRTVDTNGGSFPSIVVNGNRIYLSFVSNDFSGVIFKRSDDNALTWAATKLFNPPGTTHAFTSLAVDGTNVYIAYYDATNGDLKVAKSIDNGDTW
ncbi:MAG: exo-alpha-sialidase [Acidobacteria bacterium]|nr:exo-alpha-sialidase [Acidobacteriota bacterium]